MSALELDALLAEQAELVRQTHETISIGEELLDRVREVAHQVEERIHQVMSDGEPARGKRGS